MHYAITFMEDVNYNQEENPFAEEEKAFVNGIQKCCDWGFPLSE